jgi:hypothetical protein
MNEKKLRLNKETIRNLSDENLEQVAGGKKKGGNNNSRDAVSVLCCNASGLTILNCSGLVCG